MFFNLNPSFNKKGSTSKKMQFDVQANTLLLTNLVTQLELAKITLSKETPLILVIDKPIYPLEKIYYGSLITTLFGTIISIFLSSIYLTLKQLVKKLMK